MGSYDGAQAALNPLNFPVCLHDKELKFVTVGFTPSFADWLPFPGPSSLSYETALLIQHLSHLGPACPMPNHWPGKSVWLLASLSPQESASLELLQTGGPATTAALPVFAHLCHPRLEEELTLWRTPHQYIEMR